MTARPPIAAVPTPHGYCSPGCPYCPPHGDEQLHALVPDPVAVSEAVDRVHDRLALAGEAVVPVEIGLYGGDLWQLPRRERTDLLDAAEWEVRRGRATGIRLVADPLSVLRAPLNEFRARGVTTVEVPVHSLDRRVLRRLGMRRTPRAALEAIGRLNRFRMRSVAHLTPGLPGSSHRSDLASVEMLARARPRAARVLPALALGGTLLGQMYEHGIWHPMSVAEAIATSRHVVARLRATGTEVIRVGLQPEVDLLRGPLVLAGPFDPALRLRVEAELMRIRAAEAIGRAFRLGTRAFTLVVHPREESWLRGPCSSNLASLKEQFRLDELRVLPMDEQPSGELRAFEGQLAPGDVPPVRPRRKKAS